MTADIQASMIADIVEQRARKICERRGIDPDNIVDEYGPVHEWCREAYHIGEAVKAATESLRDQIAADKRRIVALEAALREIGRKSDEPTTVEQIAFEALETPDV